MKAYRTPKTTAETVMKRRANRKNFSCSLTTYYVLRSTNDLPGRNAVAMSGIMSRDHVGRAQSAEARSGGGRPQAVLPVRRGTRISVDRPARRRTPPASHVPDPLR